MNPKTRYTCESGVCMSAVRVHALVCRCVYTWVWVFAKSD